MKHIVMLGLLLANLGSAQKVTVFAASSLTEVFEDVATAFEAAHAGAEVVLNFAGSSTLSAQIVQGAPADVFASANQERMTGVVDAGLVVGEPEVFAVNKLVVVTPRDSTLVSLADLAAPGVKVVLAAPEVPVGAYAREVLANLNAEYGTDFGASVAANLVSEEPNVRQAAAKVELGEADAALVYATDAAVLQNVRLIDIPAAYNVSASYPLAVLKDAPQPELAQAFVAFVLSAEGQTLLAQRGFISVP